jgi:replicative DNA helicase
MSDKIGKIDKILQKDILSIMLKDQEAIFKLRNIIQPDYFSIRAYRFIFKTIIKHHNERGELLSKKLLLLKINKIKDDDNKGYLRKKLLSLYSRKVESPKGILDETWEWSQKQQFGLLLEKASERGSKGDVEGGKELLKSSFLFDIHGTDFKVFSVFEEWDERQKVREKRSKNKQLKIKTGLGMLDDHLSLYKDVSNLITVMGTSGVGKSITSINLGVNAINSGCKVLHCVFENTAQQTLDRYDTRILKLPYYYIRDYKWKKKDLLLAKALMKKMSKNKAKHLKIVHAPIDTISIIDIEGLLRDLELSEGWVPEMIIYDSLDHILPSEKQESFRLDVKRTYIDAKRQSEIRNIPVASTTHAKASAKGTKVRQESFSESYDKVRLSDCVITISQSQEQEDDSRAEYWIDKNRDEISNIGVLVQLLFKVMSIRVLNKIDNKREE